MNENFIQTNEKSAKTVQRWKPAEISNSSISSQFLCADKSRRSRKYKIYKVNYSSQID